MIVVALLSLLSPMALPSVPAADQQVTYATVAQPMKRVFAELTSSTGVKLDVSVELAREPLIVRVRGASLKELLDRVAQTVRAEWQREGDTLRLVRSPQQTKALADAETGLQTTEAREILDRERKWLTDHPTFGEAEAGQLAERVANALRPDPETGKDPMMDYERTRVLNDGSPSMRLLRRLVCTLDARTFATLPTDERVVFAIRPGVLQRRFSAGAAEAVADFAREWSLWAETARTKGVGRFLENRNTFETNLMHLLRAGGDRARPIAKVLMDITKNGWSSGGTVRVVGADAAGKVVFEVRSALHGNWLVNAPKNGADSQPTSPAISFSPVTTELLDVSARRFTPGVVEPWKLSERLRERLLSPESHDPLSSAASEGLVALAQKGGEQLVAYVPDEIETWLESRQMGSKITLSQFEALLKVRNLCVSERSSGWFTVRPSRPLACLRQREDRGALGTFLRATVKAGRTTLDDEAAYVAAHAPDRLIGLPAGFTLSLFGLGSASSQGRSPIALWLHGSWSQGQRATLSRGDLAFGQLSALQQSVVIRILKEESAYLVKDEAPTDSTTDSHWAAFPYGDLRRDATELLPEGVPRDARIVAFVKSEPSFRGQILLKDGNAQEVSLTGISAAQALYSLLHTPPDVPQPYTYSWIEPHSSKTTTYQIRPLPGLRQDIRLSEFTPAGKRVSAASDLPAEFLRTVEDTFRNYVQPPPPPPRPAPNPVPTLDGAHESDVCHVCMGDPVPRRSGGRP